MVGANKLALNHYAGFWVNRITENLSVAIYHAVFSREMLIFSMNMKGVWLVLGCTEFSAQIFVIDRETELVVDGRVVAETVVKVVV